MCFVLRIIKNGGVDKKLWVGYVGNISQKSYLLPVWSYNLSIMKNRKANANKAAVRETLVN